MYSRWTIFTFPSIFSSIGGEVLIVNHQHELGSNHRVLSFGKNIDRNSIVTLWWCAMIYINVLPCCVDAALKWFSFSLRLIKLCVLGFVSLNHLIQDQHMFCYVACNAWNLSFCPQHWSAHPPSVFHNPQLWVRSVDPDPTVRGTQPEKKLDENRPTRGFVRESKFGKNSELVWVGWPISSSDLGGDTDRKVFFSFRDVGLKTPFHLKV